MDTETDFKAEAEHLDEVHPSGEIQIDLSGIEETATTYYVWLITLASAVGGFLFGYDTSIISGTLVLIGNDLKTELTSNKKELITSITSGGAFMGALLAGYLSDTFGRRSAIIVGSIVFFIGSILQAASYSLAQMTVGRLVVGFGVGTAAMVVPVYIGEVAPTKLRGRMLTIEGMSINFGQLIASCIGAAFENCPAGWRYMVGLGGVPAILLFAFVFIIPESPRYLLRRDDIQGATKVLLKIYSNATPEQVDERIRSLSTIIREEQRQTTNFWQSMKILHTDKGNFTALVVACMLMGFQQFSGENTLMYYGATIFALTGFNKPLAVNIVISATNFIFTFIPLKYVDIVGRRRMLIYTTWGMAASLTAAAVAFHYVEIGADLEVLQTSANAGSIIVLVAIITFLMFFASAISTIGWQGCELFSTQVRAAGTMIVTCVCWGSNVVVSSTYLSMMETMTPSGAMGFYACVCFVGWLSVVFFYPEVSGFDLEEIHDLFKHGFFGVVKHSNKLRREKQMVREIQP